MVYNIVLHPNTYSGKAVSECIIISDRQGIRDPKAVESLWDKLIEAMKLQLKRNHSTEENLFGTALVKLSELRTLGSHHNELLKYYRANWHRCSIPPLFSEIYDIPKNERSYAAPPNPHQYDGNVMNAGQS